MAARLRLHIVLVTKKGFQALLDAFRKLCIYFVGSWPVREIRDVQYLAGLF